MPLQTLCVRHEPPGLTGDDLDRHTQAWAERVNRSGRRVPDAGDPRRPLDGARLDRRGADRARARRGAVAGDAADGGAGMNDRQLSTTCHDVAALGYVVQISDGSHDVAQSGYVVARVLILWKMVERRGTSLVGRRFPFDICPGMGDVLAVLLGVVRRLRDRAELRQVFDRQARPLAVEHHLVGTVGLSQIGRPARPRQRSRKNSSPAGPVGTASNSIGVPPFSTNVGPASSYPSAAARWAACGSAAKCENTADAPILRRDRPARNRSACSRTRSASGAGAPVDSRQNVITARNWVRTCICTRLSKSSTSSADRPATRSAAASSIPRRPPGNRSRPGPNGDGRRRWSVESAPAASPPR